MIINITEIASTSLCRPWRKRKGTAGTVCTLRRFGAPGEFQIIEFFFFFNLSYAYITDKHLNYLSH